MERVVKRFLMHNQCDIDNPKENEYDGYKQDLQIIRSEMMNDVKKAKEENFRNMFIINAGLEFVAEEIAKSNSSPRNQFFKFKDLFNENNSSSCDSITKSKNSETQFFFAADNLTPKKN